MPNQNSSRPPKRLPLFRSFLWRWHKRAGLMAALIVIMVSITGIFLNHTSELGLGKQSVRSAWLLSHYGYNLPEISSYQLEGFWLSGDENGFVYYNSQQVALCAGGFKGALRNESAAVVACGSELLLLSQQGELIERLGESYGAPAVIERIGLCQGGVCLASSESLIRVDLDRLVWEPVHMAVQWSQPEPLPDHYYHELVKSSLATGLSWERVLQDLHSGRIIGSPGVWLIDLSALLLLFLSLSGFILWFQRRKF